MSAVASKKLPITGNRAGMFEKAANSALPRAVSLMMRSAAKRRSGGRRRPVPIGFGVSSTTAWPCRANYADLDGFLGLLLDRRHPHLTGEVDEGEGRADVLHAIPPKRGRASQCSARPPSDRL